MAVVNSFILFKEHQAQFSDEPALKRTADYSLTDFREEIVRQLCGFAEYDHPLVHVSAKPAPPPSDHGPFLTEHIPIVGDERRMCVVCWKTKRIYSKVQTYCSANSYRAKGYIEEKPRRSKKGNKQMSEN